MISTQPNIAAVNTTDISL